jgi:uncharacterized membrane protein
MWVTAALTSAMLFATVHIIDEYCVDHILEKPYIGVITSALASMVAFLSLPFIVPIVGSMQFPSGKIVVYCLAAGALIQVNQALYFKALSYSEAGTVAGYWNMVPAFLPFISYLVFGEVLELNNYRGIYLIVLASLGLCLLDKKTDDNTSAFLLILMGVTLQIVALLLMKQIFKEAAFYSGFLLITSGMIIVGLLPLALKSVRRTFLSNFDELGQAMHLFIIVEIINLAAYGALQKSIQMGGNPSLVAAIDATTPGFAFLFSVLFLLFTRKFGNTASQSKLTLRFVNVGVMFMGVWLVA